MKQEQKSRSGKAFFLAAVFLVFAAILATVLFANDRRNLHRLMTRFGIPVASGEKRSLPRSVTIRQAKGVRLPPARMALPVYAFADMKAPEQRFARGIRSDPRTLCERLRSAGFGGMDWSASTGGSQNWECSSLSSLSAKSGEETPQSSIFVFIKGDAENRVTSFRVKLNIETPEDTKKITELAGTAASIFLHQVQWENGGEIIAKIRALEEFDLRNFGSRIQLKKEFGDTPRYNFLANQIFKPGTKTPAELYFDRTKWFALTGSDGLPMIDGMMAGESDDGLPLPEPENGAAN